MSLPLEGSGIPGIYDTSNICQLTVLYFKIFFYLCMVVLGLCCCVGFSLAVASRGSSLVVVLGLLIALASLFAAHRL